MSLPMPIERFAADVLDRRIEKVRKQGRHLDELSPEARHKLRIRIKKIRYAVASSWRGSRNVSREFKMPLAH
jgi:CHAD domain-containing protein